MADPRIGTLRVGGLDLARRRDFSALVTLEIAAERAVVTRALRLPQMPYYEQLALINPLISDLDRLAYDAGGVGDAVAELLPEDAIPIIIIAGECAPIARNGRVSVGKSWLVRQVLRLAGLGRLVVAPDCPGASDLKRELTAFAAMPTGRGVRLEARGRAHDDLVLALSLATLGCPQGVSGFTKHK